MFLRGRGLTFWITVSIMAGIAVGYFFPDAATGLRIFSQIFLRLIRTIVAPLLFATLVVGIAGHSSLRQVGRMGLKSLIYFEVVTTLALLIGWAAITVSQAGAGISLPARVDSTQIQTPANRTWQTIVLDIFPENIAKSVAENQVLQVVVFAVLFGCALAMVPEHRRRPLLSFTESLAETMFAFTRIVMYLAPLGVGAAIAYTVGNLGIGVLINLFKLLATFMSPWPCSSWWCSRRSPCSCACRYVDSSVPSLNLHRLRSRRQVPKRRCRGRWRRWSVSACRARSWPS